MSSWNVHQEQTACNMPTCTAKKTIAQLVGVTGGLETLAAALMAANLGDALGGAGPFTVFAPVNSAFDALPAGTVASLLQPENREQLTAILTYHVVSGKVFSRDLLGKRIMVATLNGDTLSIDGTGDQVLVNGTPVVTADVKASNGVVHLIGAVLLPRAFLTSAHNLQQIGANFVGKDDGNDGAFRSLFRVLWSKHAAQTRELIVATLDKKKSAAAALDDLLLNQQEIGGSIGAAVDNDQVGVTFTRELQNHIKGAGKILAALMKTDLRVSDYIAALGTDDKARLRFPAATANASPIASLLAAIDAWYENGELIVSLVGSSLGELSRNKKRLVATAFNQHLYHTIVEAILYYAGEYAESLRWAHGASSHLMVVSDLLTNGLIEELGGKVIGLRLSAPLKRIEKFLQALGTFYVPSPKEVAQINSSGGGGGSSSSGRDDGRGGRDDGRGGARPTVEPTPEPGRTGRTSILPGRLGRTRQ